MLPEEIEISQHISKDIRGFLDNKGYDKIAVVIDENTSVHCLPLLDDVLGSGERIQIKSGEEHKNLDTCVHIWEELTRFRFDRKSLLVNLGGGVIGDMGGFCAATFKRGIDFINVPTTLLAQVDASVGGKLGIDFQGFKNHIGVFRDPRKVFIDTAFLETLPERELRSGFAEVIKHCLIADSYQWKKISASDYTDQLWPEVVRHSIEVKSRIVQEDPYEKGRRKVLNFGHTIGHAIESYFLVHEGKKLLHGEAIAAGMICETFLSEEYSGLSKKDSGMIREYLLKTYGKTDIRSSQIDAIVELCRQDKKNEKGMINFSLLQEIGIAVFNIPVEQNDIRRAISWYMKL